MSGTVGRQCGMYVVSAVSKCIGQTMDNVYGQCVSRATDYGVCMVSV